MSDRISRQVVKGFPIDADLLMLKAEEKYGFRARNRLYELIRNMDKYELPSSQPERERAKWIATTSLQEGQIVHITEAS